MKNLGYFSIIIVLSVALGACNKQKANSPQPTVPNQPPFGTLVSTDSNLITFSFNGKGLMSDVFPLKKGVWIAETILPDTCCKHFYFAELVSTDVNYAWKGLSNPIIANDFDRDYSTTYFKVPSSTRAVINCQNNNNELIVIRMKRVE